MATSTPSQRLAPNAPTGFESATPATRGGWGRNGEPGAAFRGLSRGRGAGGGGAIRGGRGGRWGGGALRGTKGAGGDSSPAVKVDEPAPAPAKPTPVEKPSVPTSAKSKNPSRRASRGIPALIVNQTSLNPVVSSAVSAITTSRPSTRRRRSQQNNKPPLTSDKLVPSDLLRPVRSHSGPASPIVPSKDTPPHLVASGDPEITSFDMRTNIDALVERVRAVAMAENRPTTPGSHIDWAGDDDDSLPDLNDWGVTTSTGDKDEMISPILVDGLKPLPDAAVKDVSSSGTEEMVGISSMMNDHDTVYDIEDGTHDGTTTLSVESASRLDKPFREEWEHSKRPGRALHLNNYFASKPINGSDEAKPEAHSAPADRHGLIPSRKPPTTGAEPLKTPLHPSLPPKPVAAVESLSRPCIAVTSARTAETLKSASVEKSPVKSAPTLGHSKVQVQDAAVTPSAAEPSVAQVPSSAPSSRKVEDVNAANGLAASIHAPKILLEPSSTPSDIASYGTSLTRVGGFTPTHNRASTVGRLPHPQPHPAPVNSLPGSGSSTPRRYFGSPEGYHARTHSTPPSGHRMAHSRPVITGDAISRLARTLLPSRTTDVSVPRSN